MIGGRQLDVAPLLEEIRHVESKKTKCGCKVKSEYRAMTFTTSELTWVKYLLQDLVR